MKKLEGKKIVKTCDTCVFGIGFINQGRCIKCDPETPDNFRWQPGLECCKNCFFQFGNDDYTAGKPADMFFCRRFKPPRGNEFGGYPTTILEYWCQEWQLKHFLNRRD